MTRQKILRVDCNLNGGTVDGSHLSDGCAGYIGSGTPGYDGQRKVEAPESDG